MRAIPYEIELDPYHPYWDFQTTMEHISSLRRSMTQPLMLDLAGRIAAAVFFGFFALRMLRAYLETGGLGYLLLLLSELLVIGLVLARRTTRIVSSCPADWIVALIGTTLPLLAAPGGTHLVGVSTAGSIMLGGLAINIWAKLSLRRSFGIVAANRGVKTRGAYCFVRHPMYLGYMVTQVGFCLLNPTLWNIAVYSAAWTFLLLRIFAEERVLSGDLSYKAYSSEVRYRLVPHLF
jgi:protein-S-isoprenylcysteine O-methyltransferase Ste14